MVVWYVVAMLARLALCVCLARGRYVGEVGIVVV